jgi:hypothetical protein
MKPNLSPGHLRQGHLSDDQLIQRLYNLDSDPHLDVCPDCQARWTQMEQRRAAQLAEMSRAERSSAAFFAAQLQRIQERIDEPAAPWLALRSVWVPATLALLLGAILLYSRVATLSSPGKYNASTEEATLIEATWFDDAYESVGTVEPRAASPLRELFAEEVVE